jgi:AraC-like DNA-binding protein
MKPEFEKIEDLQTGSFIAKTVIRANRPLLSQAWHYHPEIEICLTKKSIGKRYVGNKISDYEEGDLVMIGSLLPHGFTTTHQSEQIVLQLNRDFLGVDFLRKSELRRINELIDKAKTGLEFSGDTKQAATQMITSILETEGFIKLLKLLELLNLLSNSTDYRTICSKEYSASINIDQLNRMKRVFDYIQHNFQQNITIVEAAELINLTESAFYKFIKKHTKKKFTQILNEYRANHASKLLIESELSIAEICYDSGYNNLSYFNRKFKEILGVKPSEFRDKYK